MKEPDGEEILENITQRVNLLIGGEWREFTPDWARIVKTRPSRVNVNTSPAWRQLLGRISDHGDWNEQSLPLRIGDREFQVKFGPDGFFWSGLIDL